MILIVLGLIFFIIGAIMRYNAYLAGFFFGDRIDITKLSKSALGLSLIVTIAGVLTSIFGLVSFFTGIAVLFFS